MPLLNDADAIYLGAAQAAAVYVGATKVWPPAGGGPTPTIYTWIGNSGSVIVGAGEVQRYTSSGHAYFGFPQVSGPDLDFDNKTGKTLTMVGQTSGFSHSDVVTGGGGRRCNLTNGIPVTNFDVGENVACTLE